VTESPHATEPAWFFRIARTPAGVVSLKVVPRTTVTLPLDPGNYYQSQVRAFHTRLIPLCVDPHPTGGRLALLDGPTGGGKTYFARALIDATPTVPWVRTDPSTFLALAEGDLADLADLAGSRGPRVLWIEDADTLIRARDENNPQARGELATLLALGDGSLGLETGWRVVLSTNMAVTAIDAAVLRPGRMATRLHFGPLTALLAEAVYRRLTGRPMPLLREAMLANLYALAARAAPVVRSSP
jgi:ATP-dependent 26S proteasome regulatory subunit